jgi:dATP pyrophosphohydrolase
MRHAMVLRRKVQVFVYRQKPSFEVLLLKRAKTDKGEWHPITGNVEAHEQTRAAAVREAWEEVTLDVEPEPLGVTFTYETKGGRRAGRYHETAYASAAPADDSIELSEEHTAYEWVSVEEAEKRLTWPEQKRALAALVARYIPK